MGWRQAQFKGKDVWVEVDEGGSPKAVRGRVPMRYSDKPGAKVYGAGLSNVQGVTGPTLDLEAGTSADAPKKKGASRGSGFGSAGSRTVAQAAMAADAARAMIAGLDASVARCFTDGGCTGNPGPAGSGAVVELPDGRRAEASRSLGTATNNIGELTAIGMALALLDEAGLPADAPAVIFTDSKYANGVLSMGWKAKANAELVKAVRAQLKARPNARIQWIAGHVGVAGNEKADQLAGDGIRGVTTTRWLDA